MSPLTPEEAAARWTVAWSDPGRPWEAVTHTYELYEDAKAMADRLCEDGWAVDGPNLRKARKA